MKVVLSIAGSDSSGGAGIQADLKTMTALGVYGMTAITALTAQNTTGVFQVVESTPEFLDAQIKACLEDISVDAVKIGMLPSPELVKVVVSNLEKFQVKNLVVDPVMVATSGSSLMGESTKDVMAKLLFPMSTVITPNIPEAEALTDSHIRSKGDMEQAAKSLGEKYGCAVLLKGGHELKDGNDDCKKDGYTWNESSDVLYDHGQLTWFEGKRIDNPNTHGTGCTLSSAIASNLALGCELKESVQNAKDYLTKAIAAGLDLGKGHGPLNHMV